MEDAVERWTIYNGADCRIIWAIALASLAALQV